MPIGPFIYTAESAPFLRSRAMKCANNALKFAMLGTVC